MPVFICAVVVRLAFDSRASYFRIQKMLTEREQDSGSMEYLRTLLEGLRGEVHGAIDNLEDGPSASGIFGEVGDVDKLDVDVVEDKDAERALLLYDPPSPTSLQSTSTHPIERHIKLTASAEPLRPDPQGTSTSLSEPTGKANKARTRSKSRPRPTLAVARQRLHPPQLSPSQLQMAASLNSIPHLKKKLAYIDDVVNSHPVIIVRDAKKFKHHVRGMGVLRDWAESFEL